MLCKRAQIGRRTDLWPRADWHLHLRRDHDETNGNGFVDDCGCGHWHGHRLSLPSSSSRRLLWEHLRSFQLWRLRFKLWRLCFRRLRRDCDRASVRLLHGGLCQHRLPGRQCRALAPNTSAGHPHGSLAEHRLIGRDDSGSDRKVGRRVRRFNVPGLQQFTVASTERPMPRCFCFCFGFHRAPAVYTDRRPGL
jgi:hypothetical protein